MEIDIYTGGLAETNGYLVKSGDTCILFDAPEGIYDWLKSRDIKISHLLLTHQHWDHCNDAAYFDDIEIIAFDDYSKELTIEESFKQRYHLSLNIRAFKVDKKLKHEESITIGDITLETLHVPGHSPDSIAFHCKEEQMCIGGDVLFYQSCGRVDLPGSDAEELVNSIENVLFKLPTETTIFPGHGPETSIEEEKNNNPYKSIV